MTRARRGLASVVGVAVAALVLAACSNGTPQARSSASPATTARAAVSSTSSASSGGGSCQGPATPEQVGTVLAQWDGAGSRTVSFSSCLEQWGLADIYNCPSSDSTSGHTVAVYQPGDTTPRDSFGGELGPGQGIDSWGTPEYSQVAPPATGRVSIRLSFPAGCRWEVRAVAGGTPPPAWGPAAP